VEFRILESPEVLENGHQVPLHGSEQRAMLASLLHGNPRTRSCRETSSPGHAGESKTLF
jgi:hypothetical protein